MRESPLNNKLSVAYSYIAAVDLRTGSVDVLKSVSGKGQGRYEGAMNQNLQRDQALREVAAEYQKTYLDFIIKILSYVIGGNPLPLGGGRSLVNL